MEKWAILGVPVFMAVSNILYKAASDPGLGNVPRLLNMSVSMFVLCTVSVVAGLWFERHLWSGASAKGIALSALGGLGSVVSFYCILTAYQAFSMWQVETARSAAILLGGLLGLWWLDERTMFHGGTVSWRFLTGFALIILGILIALGSGPRR